MTYADRTKRPPRTLTERETKKLLDVTGKARDGFRDHVIISLALGCGLRESEICALQIRDVSDDGVKPRRTIQLRVFKRAGAGASPKDQVIHLPDTTFYKVEKYLKTYGHGHPGPSGMAARFYKLDTQLFWPRSGGGVLSTRAVRKMFAKWCRAAGLQGISFHSLRHTAISNVRRSTGDIRITQRFARHANIATTVRYEHASDEEVAAATKGLQA